MYYLPTRLIFCICLMAHLAACCQSSQNAQDSLVVDTSKPLNTSDLKAEEVAPGYYFLEHTNVVFSDQRQEIFSGIAYNIFARSNDSDDIQWLAITFPVKNLDLVDSLTSWIQKTNTTHSDLDQGELFVDLKQWFESESLHHFRVGKLSEKYSLFISARKTNDRHGRYYVRFEISWRQGEKR